MPEPVLRAAWPNGNSGGARTRTGWRANVAAKGEAGHAFFDLPGGGLTIWFTVLFAALPFGVHSQHETGDIAAVTDPGAPVAPGLSARLYGQTLSSVAVFAALVAVARLCWLIFASIDPSRRCG